jgi:hypothetical protein
MLLVGCNTAKHNNTFNTVAKERDTMRETICIVWKACVCCKQQRTVWQLDSGRESLEYRCDILIYVQQDAMLRSLFYLESALFMIYLCSGSTTTHHQKRIQLYLQHLVFVTPLLLYAAIVEELEPV